HILVIAFLAVSVYGARRELHSFPTRRSSDLEKLQEAALDLVKRAISGELDYKAKRQPKLEKLKLNAIEQMMAFETSKGIICSMADRKSTRLNSSHVKISYAVFCLKKKIIRML